LLLAVVCALLGKIRCF